MRGWCAESPTLNIHQHTKIEVSATSDSHGQIIQTSKANQTNRHTFYRSSTKESWLPNYAAVINSEMRKRWLNVYFWVNIWCIILLSAAVNQMFLALLERSAESRCLHIIKLPKVSFSEDTTAKIFMQHSTSRLEPRKNRDLCWNENAFAHPEQIRNLSPENYRPQHPRWLLTMKYQIHRRSDTQTSERETKHDRKH